MSEFLSQSNPVVPPSIEVSEPKVKSEPTLYMNNERNMLMGILISSVILFISLYLPSIVQSFVQSNSLKHVSISLCFISLIILFYSLFVYKRNIDAFKSNEQEYINHDKTSMLMYIIGAALMIIITVVLYEMYWNVSQTNTKQPVKPELSDFLDDAKSVGSISKSSKGSR